MNNQQHLTNTVSSTESQGSSFEIKAVLLLWQSLDAEYPQQWVKAMDSRPITESGKLTVKGKKWLEVMKGATFDGKLNREVTSLAILHLRQRDNKQWLPTLGQFEDAVKSAKDEYKAKNQFQNAKRLEVKPKTEEEQKAEKLNKLLNLGLMALVVGDRKKAEENKAEFLRLGGDVELWGSKVVELWGSKLGDTQK